MRLPFFAKSPRTIGYDLGGSSIKIASIDSAKGRRTVRQLLMLPVQEELIVEGIVFDHAGVAERLRRTVNVIDLKNAAVVSAIRCGREALVKYVDLPRAPRDRAKDALATDRTVNFPIAASEGSFDVVILDPEGDTPMMKAVAVAAKRDPIRNLQKTFHDAMLPLTTVDLDAFALYNVFAQCMPEALDERSLLVHVGYETAVVVLIEGGAVLTARQTTSSGTKHMLEQIERMGRFDKDEAEEILRSEELPTLHGDLLDEWIENLVLDIRSPVDRQDGDDSVGNVYITGGGALVAGFRDALGRALGTSVQILNPLEHMDAAPEVKAEHLQDGPLFAVALGLALRDDA